MTLYSTSGPEHGVAYVAKSEFDVVQRGAGNTAHVSFSALVYAGSEPRCIDNARRRLAATIEPLLLVHQTGDRQIELSGCAYDTGHRARFAEWLFVTTPPSPDISPLLGAIAAQIAAVAPLDLFPYLHPYLEGTPSP